MDDKLGYPLLEVNLTKMLHNVNKIVQLCGNSGIKVAGVIKGFNGLAPAVKVFDKGFCEQIATSRISQIVALKEKILKPFMLIRIPMITEIASLVKHVDISLNSEMKTINLINNECIKQNKTHKIILIADLGDLREGFWDRDELIESAYLIENKLEYVELIGIGTNLGCYGAIKPTVDKMNELVDLAEKIERKINRKLEIISGGATSSLPLVIDGNMPERINHLRIGEGIILARDLQDLWGIDMSYMHKDVFTVKAEVIELKKKPTHPVGEIFIDGFGNKPTYENRGNRKRALLGIGKLDYALNDKIIPREKGIEIVGSSSDHLIIDVEDYKASLDVGDLIEFDILYPAMMYLTNTKYVYIKYS